MSTSPIRGQTASQAARERARRQARRTQANQTQRPEPDLGEITSPTRGQAPPEDFGTRQQRLDLRDRVADEYETVEPEDVEVEATENRLEADLGPEAERDVAEAQIREQVDADPSEYQVERISAYGGASPSGNYPGANIQPQDRFIATRTEPAEPDIGPIDAELADQQPGDAPAGPTQRTRTDIGPGGPSQQSLGSVAGDVVAGTVSAAEATYDDPVGSAREAGAVAAETTRLEAGAEAAGEFGRETIQNEEGTIEDVTGTRTVFTEGLDRAESATGVEIGQRFEDASDYVAGGIRSGGRDLASGTGDVIRGGADVTAEVATGGPLTSDSGFAGEVEEGIRGAGDLYAGGSEAVIRGGGRSAGFVAEAPVDAAVLGNRATQASTVALQSGANVDVQDLEADVNVGQGVQRAQNIGEATAGYTGASVEQGASAVADNPVEVGTIGAATIGGGYVAGSAARSVATRGTGAPEGRILAGAARRGRSAAGTIRERTPVSVEVNPNAPPIAVADDITGRTATSISEGARRAGGRVREAAPSTPDVSPRGVVGAAEQRLADTVGRPAARARQAVYRDRALRLGRNQPSLPSVSVPDISRPSLPSVSRPDLSRPSLPDRPTLDLSPPDVRGRVSAARSRVRGAGQTVQEAPFRAFRAGEEQLADFIGPPTASARRAQYRRRREELGDLRVDQDPVPPTQQLLGRPTLTDEPFTTRVASGVADRARMADQSARDLIARPSGRVREEAISARFAGAERVSGARRRVREFDLNTLSPRDTLAGARDRASQVTDLTVRIGPEPDRPRTPDEPTQPPSDASPGSFLDVTDTADTARRADDSADGMLGASRRSGDDDGYLVADEGDMLGPASRQATETRQRLVTRTEADAPSVRRPDSPEIGFVPTFPGDIPSGFGGGGGADETIGTGTGTGQGAEELLGSVGEPTVGTGADLVQEDRLTEDTDTTVGPRDDTEVGQGDVTLLAPTVDTGVGIGERQDTPPIIDEDTALVPRQTTPPETGTPRRPPRTPLPELPDSSDPFGPSDDDGEGEGDIEEGFYLDLLGGG